MIATDVILVSLLLTLNMFRTLFQFFLNKRLFAMEKGCYQNVNLICLTDTSQFWHLFACLIIAFLGCVNDVGQVVSTCSCSSTPDDLCYKTNEKQMKIRIFIIRKMYQVFYKSFNVIVSQNFLEKVRETVLLKTMVNQFISGNVAS